MHSFLEKKILPYSFKDLFALVLEVEKYPEFLPWIEDTKVISDCDGKMVADMTINFKSIRRTYRSEIEYELQEDTAKIEVKAKSDLFKHLYNFWSFTKKGKNTILQFRIDFEFQSKMLDTIASPLFTAISKEMIIAFEKRAMEEHCGNKNS